MLLDELFHAITENEVCSAELNVLKLIEIVVNPLIGLTQAMCDSLHVEQLFIRQCILQRIEGDSRRLLNMLSAVFSIGEQYVRRTNKPFFIRPEEPVPARWSMKCCWVFRYWLCRHFKVEFFYFLVINFPKDTYNWDKFFQFIIHWLSSQE